MLSREKKMRMPATAQCSFRHGMEISRRNPKPTVEGAPAGKDFGQDKLTLQARHYINYMNESHSRPSGTAACDGPERGATLGRREFVQKGSVFVGFPRGGRFLVR